MRRILGLLVMVWLLPPLGLSLRAAGEVPVRLVITELAPKIDGRLDDLAWQSAHVFSDFLTMKPDYGKIASERTEMRLAFDRKTIYVAFRCFDSEPARVKASLAKRDGIDNDDWVGLILDTFGDQQGGYLIVCNPLGIQMDGMLNQDGNGDVSFDMVWQSAGRLDDTGYTVEMAIPLKSIRYPFRNEIEFKVSGARVISRKSEQVLCPGFFPDQGSMLKQLCPVVLAGVDYERTVEIMPAATYSHDWQRRSDTMVSQGGKFDPSLTAKYGITSDLTLDATVNPDFSQIETDAGQIDINLRSSLYYPEKRPFFLEGRENFNYGATFEADPLGQIVHTRTIVEPILGLKLTGKAGKRNVFSGLIALDEFPRHQVLAGELEGPAVDAFFAIGRYKRVLKDDSYIGGLYAGREWDGGYNRVLGGDGRFRLTGASTLDFHLFASQTRRPGKLEQTTGTAGALRYTFQNRNFYTEAGVIEISRNFQTDTGYLSRSDVIMVPLFVSWNFYPKSGLFQRVQPFYWSYHLLDRSCDKIESFNLFVVQVSMPRQSQLRVEGALANEVFAGRSFSRNRIGFRGSSQLFKSFYLEGSLYLGRQILYDSLFPEGGRGARVSAGLIFQPTDQFSTTFSLSYTDFYRQDGGEKVFDYTLLRNRTTFQVNRYLFFRGVFEYNSYHKTLTADLLGSFTYIPGTVFYVGYGSSWDQTRGDSELDVLGRSLAQTRRAFFVKASYLWRL